MFEISLGDVARVTLLCLDAADARETPTAMTVVVKDPAGTETTVTSPTSGLTLGKASLPLSVRTELVRRMAPRVTIAAADLSDGTGVVEYLHTPDARGRWQYSLKPTSPSASAETITVTVHDEFAP